MAHSRRAQNARGGLGHVPRGVDPTDRSGDRGARVRADPDGIPGPYRPRGGPARARPRRGRAADRRPHRARADRVCGRGLSHGDAPAAVRRPAVLHPRRRRGRPGAVVASRRARAVALAGGDAARGDGAGGLRAAPRLAGAGPGADGGRSAAVRDKSCTRRGRVSRARQHSRLDPLHHALGSARLGAAGAGREAGQLHRSRVRECAAGQLQSRRGPERADAGPRGMGGDLRALSGHPGAPRLAEAGDGTRFGMGGGERSRGSRGAASRRCGWCCPTCTASSSTCSMRWTPVRPGAPSGSGSAISSWCATSSPRPPRRRPEQSRLSP